MAVKNIVALTPVYRETADMIASVRLKVGYLKARLAKRGVYLRHFFLDDGAVHLSDDGSGSILVRHAKNMGLAHTVIDGYTALQKLDEVKTDVVIKFDSQEHDPDMVDHIVDAFIHTDVQAVFLPVVYWVEGQPRKTMLEIMHLIGKLDMALEPADRDVIRSIYNQQFPLGYQAFRADALNTILPQLKGALELFRSIHGTHATWGLDMLSMIMAAQTFPGKIDFLFGGWASPWKENRSDKHVSEQQQRVDKMLELLAKLGFSVLVD